MPKPTRTDLLVIATVLLGMVAATALGYSLGESNATLSQPLVCGDSTNPSGLRIAPRYVPRGKVP